MARYRQLNYGNPLPQSFLDALQDFLSVGAFNLQLTQPNNTTLQIPASAGNGAVALAVNGLFRFNVAAVSAAHPGGGAGQYDILAVASGNVFVAGGGSGETDNTDYSFGLQIVATGAAPVGTWGGRSIVASRKIGTLTWDGTKISAFNLTANGGLQAHHTTHEPGGTDPLTISLFTAIFNAIGTLAGRPAAASTNNGYTYLATDVFGGTLYVSNGTTWIQAGNGVSSSPSNTSIAGAILLFGTLALRPTAASGNAPFYYYTTDTKILYQNQGNVWVQISNAVGSAATPTAHASTHAPGGSDPINYTLVHLSGLDSGKPAASAANNGLLYFATDSFQIYRSNGTSWVNVGGAAGTSGTAFPTSGLYNGYRFSLDYNDGIMPRVWQFVYRADLDATYPWHFIGGSATKREATGLGWNNPTESPTGTAGTLNTTMPPWAGVYFCDWYVNNISGTQTGAPGSNMRFVVGASTVMSLNSNNGSAGGYKEDVYPTETTAAASAALVSHLSHNSSAGESGGLGTHGVYITPIKVAG